MGEDLSAGRLQLGRVPVDDRIKKELRLYENAKARLKDAFYKLRYCDEMWFFTTETLATGWVEYPHIADNLPAGMDLTQIHPFRVTMSNQSNRVTLKEWT